MIVASLLSFSLTGPVDPHVQRAETGNDDVQAQVELLSSHQVRVVDVPLDDVSVGLLFLLVVPGTVPVVSPTTSVARSGGVKGEG